MAGLKYGLRHTHFLLRAHTGAQADFLPTDIHRDWAVTAHIKATEPNVEGVKLQERGGAGGELWGTGLVTQRLPGILLAHSEHLWVWQCFPGAGRLTLS